MPQETKNETVHFCIFCEHSAGPKGDWKCFALTGKKPDLRACNNPHARSELDPWFGDMPGEVRNIKRAAAAKANGICEKEYQPVSALARWWRRLTWKQKG